MKIKGILLASLSVLGSCALFAQEIEHDDMYFNSEDRVRLRAKQAKEVVAYASDKTFDDGDFRESEGNPTDSYSARQVNPEYTSRARSQTARADEEDYFVNNYQYNRNQYTQWNNNFNQWYNNPWYRSNFYSPGIYGWHSPYYGYDAFSSPWYDPYWSYNGWSSSFSFHYGNSWNYGWGGNYNYWNRPYYGYNPFFGSAFGMGMYGGYWNNYRYPSRVIFVERGDDYVYGKRNSRSSQLTRDNRNQSNRASGNYYVDPRRETRTSSGGRYNNSQPQRQSDYYTPNRRSESNSNSSWSRPSQSSPNSNSGVNSRSSWENNSRSSWRESNTPNSSYSPSNNSRSSGGTSGGSGSRSGGRGN